MENQNPGISSDKPEHMIDEVSGDVVNLSNTTANIIKSELVRIQQGSIKQVDTNELDARSSLLVDVRADNITISDALCGKVESDSAHVTNAISIVAVNNDSTLENSAAGVLVADKASVNFSNSGILVANDVEGDNISTKVLLTGSISGNVETVLDTPRAALLGILAGATIGLFMIAGRIFNRK